MWSPALRYFAAVVMFLPAIAASTEAIPAPPTTLEGVTVIGLKSPLAVPYERAYNATRNAVAASGGLAELVFRLRDKAPSASNRLALTVEYGDRVIPIDLDTQGGFVLRPDAEAIAEKAVLVVNRRRQEVGLSVEIRPLTVAGPLSVSDLDRLIVAGRAARASLVPWYARVFTPTINELRICSTQTSASFSVRDSAGTEVMLPARQAADSAGRIARCVDYPGAGGQFANAARLMTPDDVTLEYVGSLF